MIIPLRTNRRLKRRSVVTESLIVLNLAVFLLGLVGEYAQLFDRTALTSLGHLGRDDFHVWQLITYQFLHSPWDIWHLAFNMLFLWVFGCAVEDRLTRTSYLLFYLMGGVVAGLAHIASDPAPVIGASGSVAAVSGAFLALFPRSTIQTLIFLVIMPIPALWLIGLYWFVDVLRLLTDALGAGGSRVAYAAHLAGYFYGFFLAFALLGFRIIKREEFDMFFLFKQARLRRRFRRVSRTQASGLWADATRAEKDLNAPVVAETALTPAQLALAAARAEIRQRAADRDLAGAAARYATLLTDEPDAVFSAAEQLDLANQLHADGALEAAARAYELYLQIHRTEASVPEVQLMLAVLYARRLSSPERARPLLEACAGRLDEAHQTLATALREELDG